MKGKETVEEKRKSERFDVGSCKPNDGEKVCVYILNGEKEYDIL